MTEDQLRRWVRGELAPAERREVSRWIVRCTSPELGPLLLGMARERHDEEADRALLALGGLWSRVVGAWSVLLDDGRAVIVGEDGGLALASLDEGTPERPEVELRWRDGEPQVIVHVQADEIGVYLTSDAGRVQRLVPPGPPEALPRPLPLPMPGKRPTAWVTWGPQLPRCDDALAELDAALAIPGVVVRALRWEPPEEDEL